MACIIVYHFFILTLKSPEAYFWVGKGMAVILLFYTPKTLYIITNAIAILLRRLKCLPASRIISRTASGIAVLSFLVIFYGVTWGRCNYKIEQQQVCIENLPDSFNGFRIGAIDRPTPRQLRGALPQYRQTGKGGQRPEITLIELTNNCKKLFD